MEESRLQRSLLTADGNPNGEGGEKIERGGVLLADIVALVLLVLSLLLLLLFNPLRADKEASPFIISGEDVVKLWRKFSPIASDSNGVVS